MVASELNVPVVFAKKSMSINLDYDNYKTQIQSFTHKKIYNVIVSKKFLTPEDHVLIIDDFLANGCALMGLLDLAKEAGARRCIPLKVSGPFHTKLMAPAGDALAQRFAGENFGTMETPVLFNCLGHEKAETDSIPQLLVKQVQSSVYMEDTLRRLGELGVDHILEVGPGNALSGFVKKTLPGVVCTAVETPEQLDAVLTAWKEAE